VAVVSLFPLGRVVATPGALDALAPEEPVSLLRRHQSGDWGEVDGHDQRANKQALEDGTRILSAYVAARGERVWVITEADRSSTCLLLPSEY
jgi:hypothetical protein